MPRQYRHHTPYVRSTTWPHDTIQLMRPPVPQQKSLRTSTMHITLKRRRADGSDDSGECPPYTSPSHLSPLFHCGVLLADNCRCTQTLACTLHSLAAKKAVHQRKISDKAWERLQNPEDDFRKMREASRIKVDNKRKAKEAKKSVEIPKDTKSSQASCSKQDTPLTSNPENLSAKAASPKSQRHSDPGGLLLALTVCLLLIACGFVLWGLKRCLAACIPWNFACPPVSFHPWRVRAISRRISNTSSHASAELYHGAPKSQHRKAEKSSSMGSLKLQSGENQSVEVGRHAACSARPTSDLLVPSSEES